MFKRRDRRPIWRIVVDFFYPRGGWTRAAQYVNHRLRRLPDTPQKISRGIAAGVFTSFTPFFGLHFLIAALLAKAGRGNILASLMATFFGNPLTFPAIGLVSLNLGTWILGIPRAQDKALGQKFVNAGYDLSHNFMAMFTAEVADWRGLSEFYYQVFYPYLLGGILPGMICAIGSYYISVSLIGAYQKRRQKALRAKLDQLKKKTSPAQQSN